MTDPSRLSPDYRVECVSALKSGEFDLVIIGGGVTGCGSALDAASRGLRVALIEQRDFAAGTSSRSSKMFHGGLRYLEQLRFGLVREALRERNLMARTICPFMAVPERFIYPLHHRVWQRLYVGAGVLLYDVLASMGSSSLPRHRHHSKRALTALAPGLRQEGLVGAVSYSDVVVDDARHTVALARTAASLGAKLVTSARATGLIQENGAVVGVLAEDLETGDQIQVRSRSVVNTTGVWTDEVEAWAGETATHVQASKGIHLVVPKDSIDLQTGLILKTETSVLFVIPWNRHWIIGTTDTPWNLHKAHPAASHTDIQYLLDHVNSVLRKPLDLSDVVGVYAGLRPLLVGESEVTSRLSREHSVRRPARGLFSVAGGKYTTYRVMARDAVDAATREWAMPPRQSATELIPLVGATRSQGERHSTDQHNLVDTQRLHRRYGDRVADLAALIVNDPGLGKFVDSAPPYLQAEVVYGVTHEGALHLDDVLTRRTRISIETSHRGTESARNVANLMAGPLGWDDETKEREITHYLARVKAERDSQTKPDDTTADAARMGAPDVRVGAGDG